MYYLDPLQSLNSTVLLDLFGAVSVGRLLVLMYEKVEHLYGYLVD